MKKRWLCVLLSLCMVFMLMPMTALASSDGAERFNLLEGIIYENESIQGVSDGPSVPTTFELTVPTLITGIRTYHWNTDPVDEYENATFILVHNDGTVYGPWAVSASPGYNNKPNVYWFAFPNIIIKPGTYTLVDSNNATWSWANDTGNKGITVIKGEAAYYEIKDAIAPINGGTPVIAIGETDEYTGTITWEGDPETFIPNTSYTATITLTAKDGYTFEGMAADSFRVPCAMSATNEANSGVITATFISPPNNYITDGNGVMAYRYTDTSPLDIKGFHSGSWLKTTWVEGGYRFVYLLGEYDSFSDTSDQQIYLDNLYNSYVTIPESNLEVGLIPSFANGGKAVKLSYQIINKGTGPQTITFAGRSDVQIGDNDGAPMALLSDGRGFMMYNGVDQFNFFGVNTVGVTNVDAFWFGGLGDLYYNNFSQQTALSISDVDSGMSYSWHNKTIAPGQTRTFSVLIGIGGAGSEIPTELGVLFDSLGGSEVAPVAGLSSGDTISPPTPPTRSGYTFGGWYTDAECTNPFNFTTQITATITLYAKWIEKTAPSGGGSYTSPKYPVTDANQGIGDGGKTTISQERAGAGDTVIITVAPDKGYESEKPVVLDSDKKPVDVRDNGDGTFSFNMPAGEVSIDVDFSRIDYFDDVDKNDWFDEASWYCAAHGLMQGTDYRQFDGHTDTNRAMLVTVLYRLANSTDNLESIFDDVESGEWYSDAIGWAAHNNIVEGYGNGLFGPNDALTREQMVSVLYRYSLFMKYGVEKQSDLDNFMDADMISAFAVEAMKWAVGNGIVEGVGNGLLSPETGASRAQFAAMMQRYITTFVK